MNYDKNESLGYLLNTSTNALHKLAQRKLISAGIDVPFAQLKMLLMLSFNQGLNQQELGNEMNISKPAVSRMVSALCALEAIEQRSDKTDRRNKKLYVTESGMKLRNLFFPILMGELSSIEKEMGGNKGELLKSLLIDFKTIVENKLNNLSNDE